MKWVSFFFCIGLMGLWYSCEWLDDRDKVALCTLWNIAAMICLALPERGKV